MASGNDDTSDGDLVVALVLRWGSVGWTWLHSMSHRGIASLSPRNRKSDLSKTIWHDVIMCHVTMSW